MNTQVSNGKERSVTQSLLESATSTCEMQQNCVGTRFFQKLAVVNGPFAEIF